MRGNRPPTPGVPTYGKARVTLPGTDPNDPYEAPGGLDGYFNSPYGSPLVPTEGWWTPSPSEIRRIQNNSYRLPNGLFVGKNYPGAVKVDPADYPNDPFAAPAPAPSPRAAPAPQPTPRGGALPIPAPRATRAPDLGGPQATNQGLTQQARNQARRKMALKKYLR